MILFLTQTLYEFVVVVNICASVFIYAATVQGYDNSWLQSVNGLDPQFASETEVCSCTVQGLTY